MKKIFTFVLTATAVAAIVLAAINTKRKYKELGAPMTIDQGPHGSERLEYERMRLADPATGEIPRHIRERELAFAATLPNDGMIAAKGISTLNWTSRGPWNLGGRTRALGIDVSNESNILAGSASGGMWRSADGGTSWSPTTSWAVQQSVTCLAQDIRPGHTSTWYYGSGEAYGASASGGGAYYLGNGIYKSTDGGATWTSLTATSSNTPHSFDTFWDAIWNIDTDPSETVNDEVYAATLGAVYRSTDGGTSWTAARGGSTSAYSYFTDVQVTSSGVVYATLSSDGPQKGIWRSIDGISWTNITPPNFPADYNRIVIGIAPSDEDQVWFLGNTPGFGQPDTNFQGDIEWNSLWKYTYLSGNGDSTGGMWSDRSSALPTTGGPFDKFNCQGSYDLVVKVKPNDTNTVFIGGTNLYRSTNGFTDDTQTTFIGGYAIGTDFPLIQSYPGHHPDQHALEFYPSDPGRMISANDGGVFLCTDNAASSVTWTPLNNGYLTSMFYTVAIDHASPGNNIVIGGAQDNGSWWTNSASPTAIWTQPRGGDGSFCAIADNQSAYYFSIQNGKVMRAQLDAAGNVTDFSRIDPIGGKDYLFINPFTLDPSNNNIMYLAGGKRMWRNNDLAGIPYAGNWDSISTNWYPFADTLPLPSTKITAVAASKTPANRLYYGTDKGKVFRVDNANATPAPAPVNISFIQFPASGYVNCIAVDPNDADHVIVVFSNYSVYSLFRTTDGGSTWEKIGGNLEANNAGSGNGPSCRWASILPVQGGNVYLVATSTGIYGTTWFNGTSTVWTQLGTNTIGNAVCDMIDVREADGLVAVATHSHGIYSTNIVNVNELGINEPRASNNFSLTNYPNPFSASTTIAFSLSGSCDVHIELMDELGRTVKVLASSNMPKGKHSIVLQGENLAPGTYYCRLRAGNATETRKILRIK